LPHKTDGRLRRVQIAADLRAEIMSGDLGNPQSEPPGQIPITSELMKRFATTGDTVQAALDILKAEDLIYSKHGKGVYVRDRDWFEVEAGTYFDPKASKFRYEVLDVQEDCPAPADVAKALGVDRGTPTVMRYRLMLLKATDEPVELSWSYFPTQIAAGTRLADRRRIPGGAPAVLAELGLPQVGWKDWGSPRPPTTIELESLNIPENASVQRTLRRIHSHDDRAVEVDVMVKSGHLFKQSYRGLIH
jgi:GntR family transcriptional regulator